MERAGLDACGTSPAIEGQKRERLKDGWDDCRFRGWQAAPRQGGRSCADVKKAEAEMAYRSGLVIEPADVYPVTLRREDGRRSVFPVFAVAAEGAAVAVRLPQRSAADSRSSRSPQQRRLLIDAPYRTRRRRPRAVRCRHLRLHRSSSALLLGSHQQTAAERVLLLFRRFHSWKSRDTPTELLTRADIQTDSHTDRHTDIHTERHTERHTDSCGLSPQLSVCLSVCLSV